MFGISLVGVDAAGGVIVGPGAPEWTMDGAPISLLGDAVAGHGKSPHSGPSMVEGSSWFTIDDIPVVVQSCLASCGHAATGQGWFTLPK